MPPAKRLSARKARASAAPQPQPERKRPATPRQASIGQITLSKECAKNARADPRTQTGRRRWPVSRRYPLGSFVVLPVELAEDPRLSGDAFRVAMIIQMHSNGPDDRPFPGVLRMAEMGHVDRRRVQRALRLLEECGHLETIPRTKSGRGMTTSLYQLRFRDQPDESRGDNRTAPGAVNSVEPGRQIDRPINQTHELDPLNETQLSENARARETPPQAGLRKKAGKRKIPDDWTPSDDTVATLRAQRPDLIGETYDLEFTQFRLWATANAVVTHNVEASFLRFMLKAHLSREAETQRVRSSRLREADAWHEAQQGHEFEPPADDTHTWLDALARRLSNDSGRNWMEIRMGMVKGWHSGLVEREKSATAGLERLREIVERAPRLYPRLSLLTAIDNAVRAFIDGRPNLTRVARKGNGPRPVTMGDVVAKFVTDYERSRKAA